MSEPLDLAAISERLRAATPGPWIKDKRGGGVVRGSTLIEFVRGSSYTQVALAVGLHEQEAGTQDDNAELIAHAPADIAALLAALKERDAEIEALKAELVGVREGAELVARGWMTTVDIYQDKQDRLRDGLTKLIAETSK